MPKFIKEKKSTPHPPPSPRNISQRRPTSSTTSSSEIVLPKSNIGYKLLQKCGWSEGKGIGALEQGQCQPIQVETRSGNTGLGFKPPYNPKNKKIAAAADINKHQSQPNTIVPHKKREGDDFEGRDIKIKRLQQRADAETVEASNKEIAKYIYKAMKDEDVSQVLNPLLRRGNRLTSSNPLL